MFKRSIFIAASIACAGFSHAAVVVNGVSGGDADGLSPFETLNTAVTYCITSSTETEILIQTNGPIPGFFLVNKELPRPLSIKSDTNFFAEISTPLNLVPTTGSQLITLENLYVNCTGAGSPPLSVGTDLTAVNCRFNSNPGGGNYHAAVATAVRSNASTGVLTMTSCTLVGHLGFQAGRSCRDNIFTQCIIEAKVSDLALGFSQGIVNSMNWFRTFAARMGTAEGFVEISEPRSLTLDRCIVRACRPIAWPPLSLGANSYFENEHSTIGPITATNTVFEYFSVGTDPNAFRGEASTISTGALPPDQNAGSTFKHCTFRSINTWGGFYFWSSLQPVTYTYQNCLFDFPLANYGVGVDPGAPTVTIAGDGNTYNMAPGTEIYNRPTFETTRFNYMAVASGSPNLTDVMGTLQSNNSAVVAQAVTLVPPVLVDKDLNPRPMPVIAVRNDVGADEINETAPAAVHDWSVY